MWSKGTASTSSAGSISARSSHSGRPETRARRSHTALSNAPAAMWTTPFSGPSQRNCESPTVADHNVAGTGDHGVDRSAEHDVGDGVDRRPLDLVATPDRERKRVAGEPIDVGAQHEVRGRVVRVRVHRVRSVEHRRGREPNVERVSSDDGRHVAPLSPFAERHASIAQTPDVCCKESPPLCDKAQPRSPHHREVAARHPMWSRASCSVD